MGNKHVDKHVITVNPYHIAMFLAKKTFGRCEMFLITFL